MKLTKEIIDVLKYHGMMTMTAPAHVFIDRYKTVEELADAGFVNDRGAFTLLNNIFDEEGKNQCAPTQDTDVVEEPITEEIPEDDETGKKEEVIDDAPIVEEVVEEVPEDDETSKKEEVIDDTPIVEEVVEEQEEPVIEAVPEDKLVESVNEETENGILIGASEETKEDVVEETPVEETPKPKKTTTKKTTTKKTTTKKES